MEWEGGRVLSSGEPGWEGRVSNWNSGTGRGWTGEGRGWGQGVWQDIKETDQADDEEELTSDEEREKVNFSFSQSCIFLRIIPPPRAGGGVIFLIIDFPHNIIYFPQLSKKPPNK